MANVTVKPVTYDAWGNGVEVTNGSIQLIAAVDFGPRIIRYGFVGGDNMFFEDTAKKYTDTNDSFDVFGGGTWHIYGGHRLWTSPEVLPRTTYPDNDPVQWREVENGIVLTPKAETWNQIQKEIEISMDAESGRVTVKHRVTNIGAWPITFSPWALSVMAAGGRAIVPQVTRNTSPLGNRIFTLWPYCAMNDHRIYWGDKFITLQQDGTERPFKFGTNNEEGWAAYLNNGNLFVKHYPHNVGATYPDNGVSFECYTNEGFLELETLGEYREVQPKETVSHQETWELFGGVSLPLDDEDALSAAIRPYTELIGS